MNSKKSTLAAAIAGVFALGVAGQATASVYGRSILEIDDLAIDITPFASATINSFNFGSTNTATLNFSGVTNSDGCFGTPGVPSATTNNCGAFGDPSRGTNAIDANVQNAPGSTVLQGENSFTVHGPGGEQYSNADSVVFSAQLTNGVPTHLKNMVESELQTGTQASAQTSITSTTFFDFNFTLAAPGTVAITFDAIQDMLASVTAPDPTGPANALATMAVILRISNDANPLDFVEWKPNGSTLSGCAAIGSFTCTELVDDLNLNTQVSRSTFGSSATGGAGSFSALFGITGTGDYTFSLSDLKTTELSRTNPVPEPSMLAMVGIGLLGLGASARRNKKLA